MKTNYGLKRHHGWSFSEIDEMLPSERMIYLDLLGQDLKAEREIARDKAVLEQKQQQSQAKSMFKPLR